jgi:hypothetical protein
MIHAPKVALIATTYLDVLEKAAHLLRERGDRWREFGDASYCSEAVVLGHFEHFESVIQIARYNSHRDSMPVWRHGTTNIPVVNVLPPGCDAWAIVLAVEQLIFRDVAILPSMGSDESGVSDV